MSTVQSRVTQGFTYAANAELIGMVCPLCGITYAIPLALQRNAQSRGHGEIQWCCPNGHQLGYHGESDEARKRKQAERDAQFLRDRLQAERDLREHTERRLSAQKAQTTKAKQRHAAALCPCCNRSFKQLAAHMHRMHPDYSPAAIDAQTGSAREANTA